VPLRVGLINTAERVVVAAAGVGKAEAVQRALEEDDCELPGGMVDAFSTIWFLDMGRVVCSFE
jgi:6-phosphogluconolactonase